MSPRLRDRLRRASSDTSDNSSRKTAGGQEPVRRFAMGLLAVTACIVLYCPIPLSAAQPNLVSANSLWAISGRAFAVAIATADDDAKTETKADDSDAPAPLADAEEEEEAEMAEGEEGEMKEDEDAEMKEAEEETEEKMEEAEEGAVTESDVEAEREVEKDKSSEKTTNADEVRDLQEDGAQGITDDPPKPEAPAVKRKRIRLPVEDPAPESVAAPPAKRRTPPPPPANEPEPPRAKPIPAVPTTPEGKIRQALQMALDQNRALHGAWASIQPDASGRMFSVDLILDSGRASAQEAEIENILRHEIDRIGGPIHYQLASVEKRPFSDILIELQQQIDDRSALAGCLVDDAVYTEDGGQLFVELRGRIANNVQRAMITNICNDEILPRLFTTPSAKDVKCKAEELQVVAPTPSAANYFFNLGVQKFIKDDYAGASQAFRRAMLDAPQRVDYQYWRVVAELAQHHDAQAYKHLKSLIERRRGNAGLGEQVAVLQSLERVQGPVRGRLLKMEQQIIAEQPDGR